MKTDGMAEIVEKKTGIITFQNTLNYGAHLQAFALCEFLRQQGYHCEIIDYHCSAITKTYDMRWRHHRGSWKAILQFLVNYSDMKSRKKKFDQFLSDYRSKETYTSDNKNLLSQNYQAFVVGSDQVWNTLLTGNDMTFFLDFAKGGKKVSYAASIGEKQFSQNEIEQIAANLAEFDGVSVREQKAVSAVQKMGVKNVQTMIDPTFLIEKKKWIQLANRSEKYKKLKKYILVYAQGKPVYGFEFAKKLAQEEHLSIVVIHGYARNFKGALNIKNASIEDFLWLILNAEHVITTSFHGMALSMILEKSFYYEEKGNSTDTRKSDLAELFAVENRKLVNADKKTGKQSIDYNKVGSVIRRERERAIQFLKVLEW